jgi:sugar O-acyltransferase (sialic acid O-acetyltransferase NeuD family)
VIIILGTQHLAKLAVEIFQQNGVVIYGLLTEGKKEDQEGEINHVPILGHIEDEQYIALLGKNCQAFVALEQTASRQKFIKNLSEQGDIVFMNAIHPLAHLASSTHIGQGNLINMGTTVGPNTHLGNHCLIHQQVAIEQEVDIQDFVQIGSGSIISAQVVIEKGAFIGAGVTLVGGIRIGANARIGAGSVVLDHVPAGATVLGNPAKPI